MPAAYDSFDYPSYWKGRKYEHECEIIALKHFLDRIPKITKLIDIGGGFGRLTPYYLHRSKRITIFDPSKRLLGIAQKKFAKVRNIKFKHCCLETADKKFRHKSYDLAIFVRVLHHIKDPEKAIDIASKLLKDGGYVILEFPNKIHGKAMACNLLRGNLTFPIDIYPDDKRCKENKKLKTLPFLNFHPDIIKNLLEKHNFKIIEIRSVSNIRLRVAKDNLPLKFLLDIESILQRPLAKLNFGPSIFVLAQKKD
jgi:ubiquinone/menaquinone biosynthesis C-methylase UbiE